MRQLQAVEAARLRGKSVTKGYMWSSLTGLKASVLDGKSLNGACADSLGYICDNGGPDDVHQYFAKFGEEILAACIADVDRWRKHAISGQKPDILC